MALMKKSQTHSPGAEKTGERPCRLNHLNHEANEVSLLDEGNTEMIKSKVEEEAENTPLLKEKVRPLHNVPMTFYFHFYFLYSDSRVERFKLLEISMKKTIIVK